MVLALYALSSVLVLYPLTTLAQGLGGSSNVSVCVGDAKWELNDENYTPCLVWAQLQAHCVPGIEVPELPDNDSYETPSTTGQPAVNDCNCNVVSYNLMAACTWCQPNGGPWVNETVWRQACPSYDSTGISNVSVTTLNIPAWAYLPDNGNSWNPVTAENYYDASIAQSSGASGSATPSNTPTSSLPDTTSPISNPSASGSATGSNASPSGSSSPSVAPGQGAAATNSRPRSNNAALIGGVVGGVGGAILLGAVILGFVCMRRRRARASSGTGSGADAIGSARSTGHWSLFSKEGDRAMSQYSAVDLGSPPASPLPVGATPVPYSYQPFSYPYQPIPTSQAGHHSASLSMDGGNPTTQPGFYVPPVHGEPYGSGMPVGGYSGLPEA